MNAILAIARKELLSYFFAPMAYIVAAAYFPRTTSQSETGAVRSVSKVPVFFSSAPSRMVITGTVTMR